jgi:hypothetical protein
MDPRQQRLAQNEALFREINERVRELAAEHGDDDHVYDFYCECSNVDCTFRLSLRVAQYEAVRRHSNRFVVLPDHDMPEIEEVVERGDGWWVVEKGGEPAVLAAQLDPRRNP